MAGLNLVTNDEVLAVNQDALCRQGTRLAHEPGVWEIWTKELADGGRALAFFNLSETDRELSVTAARLGLAAAHATQVRDLWRQRDAGPLGEKFAVLVGPHGAALFKLAP